jgi:hypothetical protein
MYRLSPAAYPGHSDKTLLTELNSPLRANQAADSGRASFANAAYLAGLSFQLTLPKSP